MTNVLNRSWHLASYPTGMPNPNNWYMEKDPVSRPKNDQILARALYLSVDPYMRGRISKKQGYAKGVAIGDLMPGGAVAQVVESKHPDFGEGDLIETMQFGWQEFSVLDGDGLTQVDTNLGPAHAWLSYLGMPGMTAWCALNNVGQPMSGETVLISAASGAVGQVAGQIAKSMGCRAIAVASSEEKLTWCKSLGYDSGVNYRTSDDLVRDMAETCPDGIDIYFDSTAGIIHDAAMQNLALGARVIIVGTISLAGKFDEPDMGERFLRQILVSRARVQGFLVFDHLHSYPEARRSIANLHNNGELKFKTDFMDGIENMPEAFLKLLHSKNLGKQLVRTEFAEGLPE